MCHGDLDPKYLMREAEGRVREMARSEPLTSSAPALIARAYAQAIHWLKQKTGAARPVE